MKVFKGYITAGCIAFTFSTVFYLIFSFSTIYPTMDEQMIVNMLFISTGITGLIFLADLLPFQNPLTLRIIELIIVIAVLLIAGAVVGMFPFTSYYIFFIVGTGALTYAIVIIFLFMGEQAAAEKINSEIRTRKRGGFDE